MVLIDYKNVDVYHNDGDAVLRGVDFHVEEGEFIYLIGQVGAGKSSLLKTFYVEMDIEKADCANVLGYDLMSIRRIAERPQCLPKPVLCIEGYRLERQEGNQATC